MKALEGKNVLITGGSLGIGLAVAKKCVEDGARVAIGARNETDLANALEELNAIAPNQISHKLDVADDASVAAFVAHCEGEMGALHGLVNLAGIYGPIGATPDVDLDAFVQAININFIGTVRMCRAVAPKLVANAEGKKKIVNFSGGGAASPFPNYSAYATSKVAIVRFTENLALELEADGVEVNCIAPGFVVTRLHQQTAEAGAGAAGAGFFEKTQKMVEDGGVPPDKAANLSSYLLSSASNGISGKFLAAPWDGWDQPEFQERLRSEKNFCTLRRIDDKGFFEKK